MLDSTGSRHRAHSPATGACVLAVTSTPSVTDSNCTSSASSTSSGTRAMPVCRPAGAGTVRFSVRIDPGRRESARMLNTNGP